MYGEEVIAHLHFLFKIKQVFLKQIFTNSNSSFQYFKKLSNKSGNIRNINCLPDSSS